MTLISHSNLVLKYMISHFHSQNTTHSKPWTLL